MLQASQQRGEPGGAPVQLNTMVFADLLAGAPQRVLDLGRVQQATVDCFRPCARQLTLGGLCEDYRPAGGLGSALDALVRLLGRDAASRSYDLVLLWDLPVYLGHDELERLMQVLAPWTDAGTRWHTFLHTGAARPPLPGLFRILDRQTMQLAPATDHDPEREILTTALLQRRIPGFRQLRTVLMRNGTQELSFHRDA